MQAKANWKTENIVFGYCLELDKAHEWGLYILTGRGKISFGIGEPDLFSEPALYLCRLNGELYL